MVDESGKKCPASTRDVFCVATAIEANLKFRRDGQR